MTRRALAGLLVVGLALTGCSSTEPSDPNVIEGEILVLTQRTDIVDTVFQDYKRRFEEKYPDVTARRDRHLEVSGPDSLDTDRLLAPDVLRSANQLSVR